MKHFNQAHIFGMLESFKEETTEKNNKIYVDVQVNCLHPLYGNVKAFGRLWGEDNIKAFKANIRVGDNVHLSGILAQYKGRNEVRRTNFNFYKSEKWDPALNKHPHRRASFILLGEISSYEDGAAEGRLFLKVRQENEGYTPTEDTFELAVAVGLILDPSVEASPGMIVRVKGQMQQEEDEYGDVIKAARPLVQIIEKKNLSTGDTPF